MPNLAKKGWWVAIMRKGMNPTPTAANAIVAIIQVRDVLVTS